MVTAAAEETALARTVTEDEVVTAPAVDAVETAGMRQRATATGVPAAQERRKEETAVTGVTGTGPVMGETAVTEEAAVTVAAEETAESTDVLATGVMLEARAPGIL